MLNSWRRRFLIALPGAPSPCHIAILESHGMTRRFLVLDGKLSLSGAPGTRLDKVEARRLMTAYGKVK